MIGIAWIIYFAPLGICFLAGLIYGAVFMLQQSSWFDSMNSRIGRAGRFVFFIIRIVILLYVARYLLRSELTPSILGAIVFVIVFWVVILSMKVFLHEWIWPVRD